MRIHGVRLSDVLAKHDHRGLLSTVYRETEGCAFRQWNCIRSHSNVLRGMHAHSVYDELYIPLQGRMFFVLKDARRGSTSFGKEVGFWGEEIQDRSVFVPRGVAHGVYFATEGVLLYGLSCAWTGAGEVGCRWDDPEIEANWPSRNPILSEKDIQAGTFAEMARALESVGTPAAP